MLKHHLSFIFTTKAERGIAAPAYDLTSVEFGAFFVYSRRKAHMWKAGYSYGKPMQWHGSDLYMRHRKLTPVCSLGQHQYFVP
jgi:hypothetical protein